jgi:hypothetical protein
VEEARHEFLDAVAYYARIRSELGRRFRNEVDQSIDWALKRPELYPLSSRRLSANQSPYLSLLRQLHDPR